ncbi:MAG: peptidylprolyl isomerase [Ginsengibacter sp.]
MKYFLYLSFVAFFISCTATKHNRQAAMVPTFVKIETDSGTMIVRLYNQTPLHKENFIKLVKRHFYDGLLFHRVISGFMIQGGDPDSKNSKPGQLLGDGGSKYTIPEEFDTALFHEKGALGMAREDNDVNPKKESSSTQFYIVEGKPFTNAEMNRMEEQFKIKIPEDHRKVYRTIGGSPFLDMNYTVFGQVVSGLEVIDKIAHAARDKNNRPLTDIRMKITLLKRNEYRKYE